MISSLISSIVQIHRRPKLEQFGFSKYDQVIYIHGQLVDEPKKYAFYVCLIYMFFFMCIYIIYIWEKYQDTPGSSSIRMPLEVPNLPNYPYVQKITLYKIIIHSKLW